MFRTTMCPSSEEITVSMRHCYLALCMGGARSAGWSETPTSRPDSTHFRKALLEMVSKTYNIIQVIYIRSITVNVNWHYERRYTYIYDFIHVYCVSPIKQSCFSAVSALEYNIKMLSVTNLETPGPWPVLPLQVNYCTVTLKFPVPCTPVENCLVGV